MGCGSAKEKKKELSQPVFEGATLIKDQVENTELKFRIQIKTEISIRHYPNLEVQEAEYQQMKGQTKGTAISSGKLLGAHRIYDDQLRVWWPERTKVVFAT